MLDSRNVQKYLNQSWFNSDKTSYPLEHESIQNVKMCTKSLLTYAQASGREKSKSLSESEWMTKKKNATKWFWLFSVNLQQFRLIMLCRSIKLFLRSTRIKRISYNQLRTSKKAVTVRFPSSHSLPKKQKEQELCFTKKLRGTR